MNTITPTAFSRLCGVTKQAIFDALRNGLLPFVQDGKKKKIDLDNPDVRAYQENETRQREVARQNTSEKQVKIVAKSNNTSKKPVENIPKKQVPSKKQSKKIPPIPSGSILEYMDVAEITKQTKIAELEKKRVQSEILKKNYLPKDFIIDGLFRYIERLNSNLERSAAVFIGEVGNKILEAGEVAPEHIEIFVSMVLEAIHNTKKKILGEIERYEPKL